MDKDGSSQILDNFKVQPKTFSDGLDVGYEKKVFGCVTGKKMLPSTVRWGRSSDEAGLG